MGGFVAIGRLPCACVVFVHLPSKASMKTIVVVAALCLVAATAAQEAVAVTKGSTEGVVVRQGQEKPLLVEGLSDRDEQLLKELEGKQEKKADEAKEVAEAEKMEEATEKPEQEPTEELPHHHHKRHHRYHHHHRRPHHGRRQPPHPHPRMMLPPLPHG